MLSRPLRGLAQWRGDERFKETWSKVNQPKVFKPSGVADFEEFAVERELGLQ